MFKTGKNPKRLFIVIKPAVIFHGIGKFSLACMTERRMAEIMRQRYRLSQIVIKSQLTADGTGNLRHFKRMGQPSAEIITFMIDKHLGLCLSRLNAEQWMILSRSR